MPKALRPRYSARFMRSAVRPVYVKKKEGREGLGRRRTGSRQEEAHN